MFHIRLKGFIPVLGIVSILGVSAAAAQTLTTFVAGNASVDYLPPGNHMVRHWLTASDTLCNDGTSPAIYVRAAANAADQNNWIIYLQAGGSCGDGESCLDRWSSNASPYGIQKMSTSVPQATWATWHPAMPGPGGWTLQNVGVVPFYQIPESIAGRGIFSPQPANPFGNWNKVFAYYCSSDQWLGQVSDRAVSTASSGDYTMHFRGATIFDTIIATLRNGALTYPCGMEECAMPDLDNAEMVLLAGSSAGANGVKHHLDKLRTDLHAVSTEMEVRGVIDATGSPFAASLPWRPTGLPAIGYEQYFQQQWTDVYQNAWAARIDSSCLSENPPEVQYRCADPVHLLRHHVTSPFFHRMDLQDSNGIDNYRDSFYSDTFGYPLNFAESRYARDIASQLHDIGAFAVALAPRYQNELAAIQSDPQWLHPGIFGPRCQTHVALIYQNPFFNQNAPDAAGMLHSYSDTLWDWVSTPPAGFAGAMGPVRITNPGVGSAGPPQC